MVNIDNITDAEWRKPSNIAQHKVMRDKINEVIAVVNEGGGVPPELVTDVASLKTDMVTVQAELNAMADEAELALLIAQLFPPVDCSGVTQLYNGDTSVRVSLPINAGNCTNLSSMFSGCSNLKMVSYIHTPNTTNMINMFYGCASLTTIPLLDTSKVTDMGFMFKNCSSLTTIPLLGTSKVTTMWYMFDGCTSLTTIPLLDTSKVVNMGYMFRICSSLTTIPSLDISSATNMGYMFQNCSSLTSVTFQCNDVRPYGNNMLNGTPIASGNGRVYVPDNLVQAYKTASGWSTHASVIYGHSAKP